MNEPTKRLVLNYLMITGILIILLTGIFLMVYYFNSKKAECISSPLVYGAKQLEEKNGVKVIGSISFYGHPEVRISFDSKNITVTKEETVSLLH